MALKWIKLDANGYLVTPQLHDALLIGVQAHGDFAFKLHGTGQYVSLVANVMKRLVVTGFREDNVVADVRLVPVTSVALESLASLFPGGTDGAEPAYASWKKEDLKVLFITPSRGASIIAICNSLSWYHWER